MAELQPGLVYIRFEAHTLAEVNALIVANIFPSEWLQGHTSVHVNISWQIVEGGGLLL